VIVYHLIKRKEPYKELGGNYFDQRNVEATAKRLTKRLEKLGYQVSIQPSHVVASAPAEACSSLFS
jgi:hypothetical protein